MRLSIFINKTFFKNDSGIVDPSYTVENINKGKSRESLKEGDIFLGSISTTVKDNGKKKRINNRIGVYRLKSSYNKLIFEDYLGNEYKTSTSGIKISNPDNIKANEASVNLILRDFEVQLKEEEERKYRERLKETGLALSTLPPEERLRKMFDTGLRNIWMVGPAGCGKSTHARNLATALDLPYLCISCGIGTSATEFIGYKYPTREATRFGEFYGKPSVILIDEITSLDPSIAQILNSALANDEIETTTGLVSRHRDCIIIATSNTFGFGCDRQYVANNQLDASTIDRFVGGILEVTYSSEYESKYDKEVVEYANTLRRFVKETGVRKVVSTRLIKTGHKLKMACFTDWKDLLLTNWSENEKNSLKDWENQNKDMS